MKSPALPSFHPILRHVKTPQRIRRSIKGKITPWHLRHRELHYRHHLMIQPSTFSPNRMRRHHFQRATRDYDNNNKNYNNSLLTLTQENVPLVPHCHLKQSGENPDFRARPDALALARRKMKML